MSSSLDCLIKSYKVYCYIGFLNADLRWEAFHAYNSMWEKFLKLYTAEKWSNNSIQKREKFQNSENRKFTEYCYLYKKWTSYRIQETDNKLKNTGNGQCTLYRIQKTDNKLKNTGNGQVTEYRKWTIYTVQNTGNEQFTLNRIQEMDKLQSTGIGQITKRRKWINSKIQEIDKFQNTWNGQCSEYSKLNWFDLISLFLILFYLGNKSLQVAFSILGCNS